MTISGKPLASIDEIADQLTDGYWEASGREARSFNISADGTLVVDLTGLDAKGLAAARQALQAWTDASGIKFVEYTSGSGMTANIVFSDDYSGAYTGSVVVNGNILTSYVNIASNFSSTGYFLQTYIHEIGHALGLGHSGNYNSSGSFSSDALFANDTWQYSIMSYFGQNQSPDSTASRLYVTTPQIADVQAIQNLYGVSKTVHAGDTTYGDDGVTVRLDRAQTIVDASGIDTLDLHSSSANQRIDLNDGTFSDIGGYRGNLALAQGTMIENVTLGAGKDTITGNELANVISSGAGNDSVDGAAGNDTITGGAGNDTMTGGTGSDTFIFGTAFGSDTITDFSVSDLIDLSAIDTITSWSGLVALMSQSAQGVSIVTLQGTILLAGATLSALNSALFILYGASDSDDASSQTPNVVTGLTLEGTASADTLTGGDGADTLLGNAGNDVLSGGAGDDSVSGGAGNDTAYLGAGNDTFTDSTDTGVDKVWGGAGDDVLTSLGGKDSLYGEDGNDLLTASDAGSVMSGGLGDDTIIGGAGADSVTDEGGNDRIELGAGNDRYTATGDTSANSDTVYGGAGNDTITGGDGNDVISGGEGNDSVSGGAGNDTIFGDAGSDVLSGGADSDVFVFFENGGSHRVTDFSHGVDVIDLSGIDGLETWDDLSGHLTQSGTSVAVDFDGLHVVLTGVSLSSLDASDFLL